MIENLKNQVIIKDKDLNRVHNELQDKNKSIDKILEKERENIDYKVQIMQNTIDQLKNDLMKKTLNYNEINDENKKLSLDNQQLLRKINLLKDHEIDLEHDNKDYTGNNNHNNLLRRDEWAKLEDNTKRLKNMIDSFNKDIKND